MADAAMSTPSTVASSVVQYSSATDIHNTTSSIMAPFMFKRLATELRWMIYPMTDFLRLTYDNKHPALLIALATDKEMYGDFIHFNNIYHEQNINITAHNKKWFKNLKMTELLKYRQIKIVWQRPIAYLPTHDHSTNFSGHKVLLMNNFETITLDFAQACYKDDWSTGVLTSQWLLKASKQPKRLFIKWPAADLEVESRVQGIDAINKVMGVHGKMESVPTSYCEELWFWCDADGKNLNLLPLSFKK